MRTLRATSLLLCLAATVSLLGACTAGDVGSFDASFFNDEDGGTADAGGSKKDAGAQTDEDGGSVADAAVSGSDAGTGVLTVAGVPGAIAAALCEGLSACRGPLLLVDTLGGEDCVTSSTKRQEDGELRFLQASIDAGRVVFDPRSFSTCSHDYAALGCAAATHRLPASCEQALQGKVALDGDCDIDLDCAGNAFCDKGDTETCPGACAAPQTEGLPCRGSHECADGLQCTKAAGAAKGTCMKPGLDGDDCSSNKCDFAFVCQTEGKKDVCRSMASIYKAALGDSCTKPSMLCAPDLVCASMSTTMGTCEAPVQKGAACRRAQPNECPRDQYCDAVPGAVGTCVDYPADGAACLTGFRNQFCAAGNVCVGNTCKQIARTGGACDSAVECYSGTCLGNICVAPTTCTF